MSTALRVSTEEQAEHGYSIAAQREEYRTRARDLGADEILEFVEENASPYEIASRLNAMGIPSPRGKRWSKQTVKRILANSAYAGNLYIRRCDARDVKFNKYRPPEERVSRFRQ